MFNVITKIAIKTELPLSEAAFFQQPNYLRKHSSDTIVDYHTLMRRSQFLVKLRGDAAPYRLLRHSVAAHHPQHPRLYGGINPPNAGHHPIQSAGAEQSRFHESHAAVATFGPRADIIDNSRMHHTV